MEEHQSYSLRRRVFQKMQDDILGGRYQQGEELRELALSKEMGVSRTPVREALRQLELEGLVSIIPNKGAYVTSITEKDVEDIYTIRSLLEGLCARWATEHITEEQINRMEEIVLLSEFHLGKEKEEQVVELDGSFHEILYEASNSRMLEHLLSDFHKYVRIARKTSVHKADRAKRSVEEHKAILQAIKEKDVKKAEMLANNHILHVMQNLQAKEAKEDQKNGKN